MHWVHSTAATIAMLVSQVPVPPATVQPPRDARSDRVLGSGSIAGRVVDRDTHQPIRWATMSVIDPSIQFQGSATTDAEGRYRFDDLPQGGYLVRARKAGFVSLAYGSRKPREIGTRIDVGSGTTASVDFLLTRGGAIEGRISNERGDPVQDVTIQASRLGYDSTGRRTIPTGPSTRTDDLGRFRLHSLPPGMYFVEASGTGLAPARDPQEAVQRPKPFPRTYYPGTARADQARYVQVEKNRTRSVEFSLSLASLNRLSGAVVNSRGETPEMTGVMLRHAGGAHFGGFGAGVKRNQFALTTIPPGDYWLVVTTQTSGSDLEFALKPVTMAGHDVVEPTIRTAPGVTLAGVVEMDSRDGTSRPRSVSIAAISTLFPGVLDDPNQRARPVRVAPDGRFTFSNLFGPRLFRINIDQSSALQAVLFDGRDVTDIPVDLRDSKDVRGLRVVVTNRTGVVSGSLADAGIDAAGTQVVLFSEDEKRWVFESRYTRVSEVRADGRFEVEGLLPGRYLIAHVFDLELGPMAIPKY